MVRKILLGCIGAIVLLASIFLPLRLRTQRISRAGW